MDDDPVLQPRRGSSEPPARPAGACGPPAADAPARSGEGARRAPVPRAGRAHRAREILGPDALLIPEQKVVLTSDPADGQRRALAAIEWYLDTPNYLDNLRWLGFTDADFEDGGSDRLVDALVAAGDEEAIWARIQEHLDAGATQVAIQPLDEGDPFGRETLRLLAPVLLG
jgi:probable F420-dependent oxidoreductase